MAAKKARKNPARGTRKLRGSREIAATQKAGKRKSGIAFISAEDQKKVSAASLRKRRRSIAKKRNGKTIIKAKRVTILKNAKRTPRKPNITSASDLHLAGSAKPSTRDGVKGWVVAKKFYPGSASAKTVPLNKAKSALLDLKYGDVWKRRAKGNPKKKRNALDYSPETPIEVTKHYRSGGPGYETKRQRVVRLGQRDLFAPEASIDELMGYLRKSNPSVITAVKRKMGAKAFAKASPSVLKRAMKDVLRAELAKRKSVKKAATKTRRNPVVNTYEVYGYSKTRKRWVIAGQVSASSQAEAVRKVNETWIRGLTQVQARLAPSYGETPKPMGRKTRRNPDTPAQLLNDFRGYPKDKDSTLYFAEGTPTGLYKLGSLYQIKLANGTKIKPVSGKVWLCADTKGKLYLGTTDSKVVLANAPQGSLGKVAQVEYQARKPHLGDNQVTRYYHNLGEETGEKPTLYSDGKGGLLFKGGATYVRSDGIHN